jgi:hypothetical protein
LGFVNTLRKIFLREQKIITQVTDPSLINRKVKIENAQLRGRVLKLEEQIKSAKKREKPDRDEEQIYEEIKKKRILVTQHTDAKKVNFIIDTPIEIGFFLKNNRRVGVFKGFQMRESNNGVTHWYPLLLKEGTLTIFSEAAMSPLEMFKSTMSIVSQLKGGKFDSNYDTTKDGKPIIRTIGQEVDSESRLQNYRSHMEQMQRDYEQEIETLNKQINDTSYELKEAKRQIVFQNSEKADMEMTAELATQTADIWSSKFSNLIQKMTDMTRTTASAVSAVQDLKIDQTLTRNMNIALMDIIASNQQQLAHEYPMTLHEQEREKLLETMGMVTETVHNMNPRPPTPQQAQQRPPQAA